MQDFLRQLPSLLVLAVLVAIFVSLQRRKESLRVRYWLAGWGFMLVHVAASLLEFSPRASHVEMFLELGTLQLAGVVFLTSVSGMLYGRRATNPLVLYFAVPVTVYSALMSWNVGQQWPYTICLALVFYGGALRGFFWHRGPASSYAVPAAVAVFGTWVIFHQGREPQTGFLGLLLAIYFITALLFLRRFPRLTPGVIATVAGFFSWSAVWGVGLWAPGLISFFGHQSELWNVPRLIVALGMIVMLLEEKSNETQAASERERAAKVQLQRFAEVTSHLLSGVDVKDYCGKIAQVITDATTFMRVAILLPNESDYLSVAGFAGVGADVVVTLRDLSGKLTVSDADELCRRGRVVGKTAALLNQQDLVDFKAVRTTRAYKPNPYWRAGDVLAVPLISPRGTFLGLIALDDPREPERVTAEEMSKIEMLAADIAVALDHANMQRQLVTNEKLAGLGQLVRGMVHEMNNPLTAVLGYAELLKEQTQEENVRRGLGVVHREALRIRGIIENLRRFAQQDTARRRSIELLPLLLSTVRQKAEEARTRGIEVVENFAIALPQVVMDEVQCKQVILNVLNNAFDAVADAAAEKRVIVMARAEDSRVVISVIDSGPGFTDVDRVFDPFFTTKSPGKGTGLGLSICYSLLRQHGGNITARNVQPTGACVTIELRAAPQMANA